MQSFVHFTEEVFSNRFCGGAVPTVKGWFWLLYIEVGWLQLVAETFPAKSRKPLPLSQDAAGLVVGGAGTALSGMLSGKKGGIVWNSTVCFGELPFSVSKKFPLCASKS